MGLTLVRNNAVVTVKSESIQFAEALADHDRILAGYFDTFVTRNLSETTTHNVSSFIKKWFRNFLVPDSTHPDGERQLFIWEAMEPARGRQMIIEYTKGLYLIGLAPLTVNQYVCNLRRLFDYVCKYPYIPGPIPQPIAAKYGSIEQPVLEYDYPVHTIDNEPTGPALTGKRLIGFYDYIRSDYIKHAKDRKVAERDYTMVVIAGEGGPRAVELAYLNACGKYCDLFYEESRIQIRYGKASRGSGKRTRKTIFTPFAQDTVRAYVELIRPHFLRGQEEDALFLSRLGNRISYGAMYLSLTNIVEGARNAGLELPDRMGWHDLRRAFATNFIEKNPDMIGLLLRMMGHSGLGTIYRYVRHSEAYYQRVMSRLVSRLMGVG